MRPMVDRTRRRASRSGLRLALLALAAASLACGHYRVVHTSEGLGKVRRVAVPTLTNASYDAGIELVVTDALRREFARHGGIEVVSDPAAADLVVTGTVLPLVTDARSLSSIAFALEYTLQMQLSLTAQRSDGVAVALDPAALHDVELYLTSADVEAERRNRAEAIRWLASVLAARVHDSLVERLPR
jgi:hypothetical protein